MNGSSTTRTLAGLLAAVALVGCKGKPGPAGAASSAAPASSGSAAAPPAPSASAAQPASFRPDAPPSSHPVTDLTAAADKPCRTQTAEIATYQQRGDLALAGRADGVAAAWLVQLAGRKEPQVGFASFDGDAHQVAHPRGFGAAGDRGPRVFSTGAEWTVTWFDAQALAFARPRLEPLPAPDVDHLSAIAPDAAGDAALSPSEAGGILAAMPFGPTRGQLGVFVLATAEGGGLKALGVTHRAEGPHAPAVAADATGVYVAWHEAGERLVTSHFDQAGKERAGACFIAAGGDVKRERLALAATGGGALALWMEGGTLIVRALDATGCASAPGVILAEDARWGTLVPTDKGAVVAWAAKSGHLVAVRVGADGTPGPRGLDVCDAVKDPPAVALTAGRVAFAYTEPMSALISSKRYVLRTVDAGCLP